MLPPVIWKAFLKGDDFDLHELSVLFSSGDTQVIKDGDSYHLASTMIDSRPDGRPFYQAARHVLALVNGVGQANSSAFRPIALTGSFKEGDHNHQVVIADPVEIRGYAYAAAVATVAGPDGNLVPPPPPPGPDRVKKAMRHADANEALQIIGRPEPTNWVDLYKVHEIVRDAMGGQIGLVNAGWVTKDDLSAFTASANRPDVTGPDARHARMSGGPPKRTMQIAEARDFIGRLLTTWLDSLQ
jgi:hypothetical protein